MVLKLRSGEAGLRKRIYSRIIARLEGGLMGDSAYRETMLGLVRQGIGGFLVESGEKDGIKAFLASAQTLADRPLYIASPVGHGTKHIKGTTHFPGSMALAAALFGNCPANLPLVQRVLAAMADETADCGINMVLIPPFQDGSGVGPGEGENSSGLSWEEITETLAAACVKAFTERGIVPVKRNTSPGSGLSHGRAPDALNPPVLIEAGAGTAPEIVTLLKAETGALVVSDDPEGLLQECMDGLPTGPVEEEPPAPMTVRTDPVWSGLPLFTGAPVDYAAHEALAREVAGRSVTLVKGHGKFLPLRDTDNIPLIYGGDEEYFLTSPLRFYVKQASHEKRPIPTHERPVVFLLFGNGNGRTGEESGEESPIERLVRGASPSIVVSFGDPAQLRRFRRADILIAACDSSDHSQEAVFACLSGERHFEGRLPLAHEFRVKERRVKP